MHRPDGTEEPLYHLLRQRGITQGDLAERFDVHWLTAHRWVKGQQTPAPEFVAWAATYFGVPPARLFHAATLQRVAQRANREASGGAQDPRGTRPGDAEAGGPAATLSGAFEGRITEETP